MVFVTLLNKYIRLRRDINVYFEELRAVNNTRKKGTHHYADEHTPTPAYRGSRNHHHHSNTNAASPSGLSSAEMLSLEKELQSLHHLAATTPSAIDDTTLTTPQTAPKEVRLNDGECDDEEDGGENASSPTATTAGSPQKARTGRFAYGSTKKASVNTAAGASTVKKSAVLGTINTNTVGTSGSSVRTEPRRWRVNQKPVENLSTDEVAVALLSKFA